jgi:hypothetical protein
MANLLNLPVTLRYAIGVTLVLPLAALLLSPAGVIVVAFIFILIYKMRHWPKAKAKLVRVQKIFENNAVMVLALQGLLYGMAFNSLLPAGMYFSPDSISYLTVSNVAPPNFSLFARSLVEFELLIGSTRIVFLRYLTILLYTVGGWLLAKSLLDTGRHLLSLLVLPLLWSMSSLTQWFNYFLTDGLATAFLVICVGAYANLHVSICTWRVQRPMEWAWLALFVLFGMLAFATRPAFAFIAPVMVLLMFNKIIFQWRRVFAASFSIILFASAHFAFANYWHGRMPTQMGGVLTALVFDFPILTACDPKNDSDLCRTQIALEPFIKASHELGVATRQQYVYKLLNNGPVVQIARSAVKDGDPNYSALLKIAMIKIKTNPALYILTVLNNSYFSVESWGDWAWNDHFGNGNVAMVNIENTNNIALMVQATMKEQFKIQFDPSILGPSENRFYKNILFQFPRLILNHQLIKNTAPILFVLAIVFSLVPLFIPCSILLSVLFACCSLSIFGVVFQNAFFPVAPRLLDPFHPIATLALLMVVGLILDAKDTIKNYLRRVYELQTQDKYK